MLEDSKSERTLHVQNQNKALETLNTSKIEALKQDK